VTALTASAARRFDAQRPRSRKCSLLGYICSMTRDFDLIRKLLVFFDQKNGPEYARSVDVGPEYSEDMVQYHMRLMYQAGLLNCEAQTTNTGRVIQVLPFDLTWEGHEFLSKIRSDTVWQKIKSTLLSKGGTLAFAAVNDLATKIAVEAARAAHLIQP
jgi:hypothetical protein